MKVVAIAVLSLLCGTSCDKREAAPPATAPVPPVPAATVTESHETCTAGKMTLCPVDEAAQDPALAAYRTKLLDAVARKDEASLLPLLADDLRVSFGGGGGIADFQKHWKTSSPDSPLWAELGAILEHGGSFIGEGTNPSFWAPYVYSKWPDDVDAFEHLAVMRAGAPLRNGADDAAAVVRTLDWAIVKVLEPASDSQAAWRHVRAADGTEGWVSTKDVRSPIGYRAGFNQVNGQWKMTALVAGD